MNAKTLRMIVPVTVLLIVGAGFAVGSGVGTLSAFGWGSISVLCPLGALGTMLASKMLVPRALISLVLAVAAIVLLGRAFCAWVCPVPVVAKLRDLFRSQSREGSGSEVRRATAGIGEPAPSDEVRVAAGATEPLAAGEVAAVRGGCGAGASCADCSSKRAQIDSRHVILGGSLLTAAVFGFPVFCLVCPIGLAFATILLVMLLFTGGDVTWSVVVVPALLAVEVVFFRKWCSKLCPLAAFMSLVGKANRTFRPAIDDASCLETTRSARCGVCAHVCDQGIDPRHPERGASWSECTKCRACVDACPTQAISMPFLPQRGVDQTQTPSASAGRSGGAGARQTPVADDDLPLAASTGLDE